MPVIHTHVSVPTTPEQREALKAAYGKAITAVPGKSEGWLMCPFEDNMPIYFGGSDDQPAAYVEVNVFGRSVPGSAWERVAESSMGALGSFLGSWFVGYLNGATGSPSASYIFMGVALFASVWLTLIVKPANNQHVPVGARHA